MAATAKPAAASDRSGTAVLLSCIAALIAVSSTFAWRATLVAWIDTSSPRYDMAEPIIEMWTGAVWLAILLLACGGAVVDRGWRWFLAGTVVPILFLGWLLTDGLIGGLRDGIVSPAGLVFGMVSTAQVALLVAWLALAVWRGRRIG